MNAPRTLVPSVLILAALTLIPSLTPAVAQPVAGPEVTVNTYDGSKQLTPTAAFSDQGEAVVVWENQIRGITGRFFQADGDARGGDVVMVANDAIPVPFRGRAVSHRDPSVVFDNSGSAFMVWTREDAFVRVVPFREVRNIRGTDIYGQRFTATGLPMGQPVRINDIPHGNQERAAVADAGQGRLVVVWQTEDDGISLRLVTPSGQGIRALGDDLKVTDEGVRPALAVNAAGEALVVWEACCDDDGNSAVFGRLLSTRGSTGFQGDAFQINTHTFGNQQAPTVAADGDGNFLVAWQTPLAPVEVGRMEYRIFGQSVGGGAQAGALLGEELILSSGPGWGHSAPQLAATPDGDLTVGWFVWQGDFRTGLNGRTFDALGNAQGDEFAINERPIGGQFRFGMTAGADGQILATWIGADAAIQKLGVSARRLR
jgi:hypothetical protein